MKLIIDIPEETYNVVIDDEWIDNEPIHNMVNAIKNGTPLPKGHGRIIDESQVTGTFTWDNGFIECFATTIIEADKKYEAKVITRGNCMMCGKELTEGLFFCKECENKANRSREGEADGK